MPRRILVVTYNFPPSRSVGALRWSLMARHLERLGHEVSVVTAAAYGSDADEDPARVVRVGGLESSEALRRLLGRPASKGTGADAGGDTGRRLVVPDAWLLSWSPFAYRAARRIVRERGIDCVVTSSPPESSHVVGMALRRLGPAWVADFRDGWIVEPGREPFRNRVQARIDAMLESRVVRRADRVVAVTDEYAEDFHRRLGVDAICVPNGWDAAREPEAAPGRPKDGPATLVYTGRLGLEDNRRRNEAMFAKALARFGAETPELADRLDAVVAGPTALPGARHVGLLSRDDALQLQRSADVLLLTGAGPMVAPAKLYEYLVARRPILHVGSEGAAARIVAETGGGVTASNEDEVVEQLRLIAAGEFGTGLEPHGLERYSYPRLAEEMAGAIEDAIRRR